MQLTEKIQYCESANFETQLQWRVLEKTKLAGRAQTKVRLVTRLVFVTGVAENEGHSARKTDSELVDDPR